MGLTNKPHMKKIKVTKRITIYGYYLDHSPLNW